MVQRTCSIDSCERPHSARGWCAPHYQRWIRYGDPLGAAPERQKTCSFPGCDKPFDSRGYCGSHAWQLRHGVELRPLRGYGLGLTCSVADCTDSVVARGWCGKHWQRWSTHGDPLRCDPPARSGSRKYTLNEHFFADINDEARAYWLGFITADGGIIRADRSFSLRVELAERDRDHLVRLCDDLGSDRPITQNRTCFKVTFDSWQMLNDLAALGIGPRKSATVQPWNGPADLMHHYWRGLFDGDGSIGMIRKTQGWYLNICGSEACVQGFAAWAKTVCGSNAKAAPHSTAPRCWYWTVGGSRKARLLAEALYAGSTLALPRKQELASKLFADQRADS